MRPNRSFDIDSAYERCADRLYTFCLRLVGNAQDAEDLVQETFIAAISGHDRFEGRSSEETWLFRIARNRAYKLLRRRTLERIFSLTPKAPEEPAHSIALAESVMQLPIAAREAFVLVRVNGFSSTEASEILGVPEGTVRFRVFIAVKKLKESWGEECVPTKEGITNAV